MSKRLNKFIASFDYFDKPLIALSVTIGGISDASIATVVLAKVGIKKMQVLVLHFQCLQLWENCWKQKEIKKEKV